MKRAFTLVEMLVVLGIIAVLVALLAPAVMSAMNSARRAAIAVEVSSLAQAVEGYKQKTGDYPPNFRQYDVFIRHVRKCYPKITPANLNQAIQVAWGSSYSVSNPPPVSVVPLVDEGESLVLWLYLTDNDPREPFKWAFPANDTVAEVLIAAGSPERYFPFKEDRLVSEDGDRFPAYRAIHCKQTCYIYIDSRSYFPLTTEYAAGTGRRAYADGNNTTGFYTRPYWSETVANQSTGAFGPLNPTTFQIICAGQDGLFGDDPADPTVKCKTFPHGGATDASYVPINRAGYRPEDLDNMTNFSEGRRLEDHVP